MSDLFTEIARKNETAIRHGLQITKQCVVAKDVGVSEGTISKWVSEEYDGKDIGQMARLLASVGLKAVPLDYEMFDPAQMEALLVLAKRGLSTAKSIHDLATFQRRFREDA